MPAWRPPHPAYSRPVDTVQATEGCRGALLLRPVVYSRQAPFVAGAGRRIRFCWQNTRRQLPTLTAIPSRAIALIVRCAVWRACLGRAQAGHRRRRRPDG